MYTKFYIELMLWFFFRRLASVPLPIWAGISVAAAGLVLSEGRPLSAALMLEGLIQGLLTAIVSRITIKWVWLWLGVSHWKTRLEFQASQLQV